MATFFPATLGALISDTRHFIEDMMVIDSITSPIAATPVTGAITIAAADVSLWPIGSRAELDDELFLVTTNPGGAGAGNVTAQRAYEFTTAQAHTAGTLAYRDPRYLKANIREAINVVVHDWCSYFFPQLVWDVALAGTFNPLKWIIPAPSDAITIERVVWKLPGFQRYVYIPHSALRMYPPTDQTGGQVYSATGNLGFEIYEQGMPGFPIEVLYGKRWPYLSADSDTVPVDFPEEAQDLIPQGAAIYLTGWRMLPKFQTSEIIYHREQAVPIPTDQNIKLSELNLRRWTERATQVRSYRPFNRPTKLYAGTDAG